LTDGLVDASGLSDRDDVGLVRQAVAEARANQGVIVGEENADQAVTSSSSSVAAAVVDGFVLPASRDRQR
jgi:hypothetical protein